MARVTKLSKPITRRVVIEGVPLVITLTERALRARVRFGRRVHSHELSALFLTVIRAAKRRQAGPLEQTELDIRVPREG